MQLGYPETIPHPLPPSMEKLSSVKWVLGAKKVGDHCLRVLHGPRLVESKDREMWIWRVFTCAKWLGVDIPNPHIVQGSTVQVRPHSQVWG